MIGITLKQQAIHHATSCGWSNDSAKTVADLAVEVAESNFPILNTTHFNQVMREAMQVDGEAAHGITSSGGASAQASAQAPEKGQQ